MTNEIVRRLFVEADRLRADLGQRHDAIDVGVVLCFALALHKLDSLTDEQFVGLVQTTLRKALADVKRLRGQVELGIEDGPEFGIGEPSGHGDAGGA